MPNKIILRPYQEKSRYWVNQQLNQFKNPLLVMPTGTGKSPTSAIIASDRISFKKRLLVLVPQYELFNQMLVDYNFLNPGYIDDSGVIGRNRNIYICMVQSLENILDSLPEKFCKSIKEIVIDEAHFSGAKTWENIYDHFSHCLRFGMTATPLRHDNISLKKYFDCMYEPIKMSEAIEKKYLCKPVIIIPDEYKNIIPETSDINKQIQKEHIKDKKIIGDMCKVYREVFGGLPAIIPCATHEHAQNVTEMYKNEGWVVDHIHSQMTKYERKRIIRDVKKGKTNILVTVGVGVFGLNIIGLAGIIWMRYTESLTIYMQFNGRPMRPAPDKKYFIFIDPVGNSVIHGSPALDRNWTLDTDYQPGQENPDDTTMKLCPVCSVMCALELQNCWICKYNFDTGLLNGESIEKRKRKLPKMIDGELVFLNEENFISENINLMEDEYGKNQLDFLMGDNNSAGIGTNGNGKENNKPTNGNGKENNKPTNGNGKENNTELTKIEKMQILSKDLTGLRMKNKFKDGIGWL